MAGPRVLASLAVAWLLAGAAVASGDASSGCGGTPSLRLVDSDPLAVKGTGFCAGERLRVRARAGDGSGSRRLRANDAGRFRVSFQAIAYDPCSSPVMASAWSSGDLRASLKHAQKLCPPA